ncbi:bacteriohemerythrin [Magnetospirillum moscoviense]|uniref:Hemerythrin-like domain-containing protein n=1 Tax=Magnetospirillum moscoviense TaxID=1437059 RepID=A0A178MYK8_9PROT|nr:hemerythrin family protein [Magnetospirillum moscoviense]MBF0323584.1 hemerythrin family protein [Alphaproteobacteria bacterium]OAN64492.1 hypothetical protein A6A05_06310 [Magnetospirillum moscoviense]
MDLQWKPEYNTGCERIDHEHMVFMDLIREFVDEAEGGRDSRALRTISQEIYKYADFHFFSEERMMARIGYAGLAEHHAIHQALMAELREYNDSLAMDSSLAIKVAEFLVCWFKTHTVTEDTKLATSMSGRS